MAHPTERARQRAKAVSDLRESCTRLAARFGVDAPTIPERFPKDPDHLLTLQMQAVSGFLDSLPGPAVYAAPMTARASKPTQGRAERRA